MTRALLSNLFSGQTGSSRTSLTGFCIIGVLFFLFDGGIEDQTDLKTNTVMPDDDDDTVNRASMQLSTSQWCPYASGCGLLLFSGDPG